MRKIKKIGMIFWLILTSAAIFAQNQNDPLLAQQFFRNGEYDKALSLYEQLYKSKTGATIFYNDYLNTLLKLKLYDEAEKIINKRIKENPSFKLDLGKLYQEKETCPLPIKFTMAFYKICP